MNEYWLMLFLTLVLEIVAIAVVSVFGMTFIARHKTYHVSQYKPPLVIN